MDAFIYVLGWIMLSLMTIGVLLTVVATMEGISMDNIAIRRTHLCIGDWVFCWYTHLYIRHAGFVPIKEYIDEREIKIHKFLGVTFFNLNH
jgi:hypothetical protein